MPGDVLVRSTGRHQQDESSPTKRWRIAGTVAAVAVTTTAGGVAWAATNADPTPVTVGVPVRTVRPRATTEPDRPGKGGPGRHGEFGLGGALHGEFIVEKDGGGYQTVATQRGEVTAVSKDAITVKSADGYSRTYTLTEPTRW